VRRRGQPARSEQPRRRFDGPRRRRARRRVRVSRRPAELGAFEARRKSASFRGLDPAVAFDQDGNAFVVSIDDELTVWKSTDGGFTWDGGAVVGGRAWDRP
jgi:hypothetical protein